MRKFLVAVALATLCAPFAHAQTYPDRPIKLLVPLAAGSAVDIVARLVADKMGDQLGQRPFVENMAGGAGVIGMRAGARANPDGYTVIVPNDSVLTMVPNMKSDAGYDPFADFMPVTQLVGIPLGLIAHPSFEANSIAELIALAKKTPGGINYSSGGPGSPQHVGMELFVRAAGIQMTHVPHRGATEAVTAIVSGSVPIGITGMSARGAAAPRQAGQAARRDDGETSAPGARCAGNLRNGAGLCLQRLVRVHGAGQDAAGDRRQAQRCGPRGAERSGRAEAAR